jgi:uncharacterized protein YbaP (TraB family)
MFKRIFAVAGMCLVAVPTLAQTESATPPAAPAAALEAAPPAPAEILVVGKRPGPGLWKVSKGDHVLWVFGTYSPLPVKMEWRSHEVEAILAQSQEFMSPPLASPDIGVLRMATVLPFVVGINNLPDKQTLADVLPAPVYQSWLAAKAKYLPSKDDERTRPILLADRLYWAALDKAGLENSRAVREKINKLVKQHKLKVTSSEIKIPVDSPVKLVRDFKKSPLEDVACFTKTLDRLENDIDALRVRANAWAKGDIDVIRQLDFADRDAACSSAILSSSVLKDQPGFANLDKRMQDLWIANVEKSLAANKSTFAVLGMKQILAPDGYLAALRAKGYSVEDPE